ncbi:MAG: nucleoside deaminase [Cyanobacteriota bacterium]|nr:nucleoside deaminase [Cyanobacteriota bacterium]
MDVAEGLGLWMDRLLRRAALAGERGEVPVAAVVLDGRGRAVGWGSNCRHHGQDPLGHAELVALRQAAAALGTWRFNHCTLLVTLEPCPMCAGALIQARMGRVVFAASDPKRGALGSCLDLASHASSHHHLQVIAGLRAQQSEALLRDWFKRRRRRKGRCLESGATHSPEG